MQLRGGQRSRFRSCRLARRLAGWIWSPRLAVAVFLLRRPTGRLSEGTRRAGLREEEETEKRYTLVDKELTQIFFVWGMLAYCVGWGLLKTWGWAISQCRCISTFCLTI